MPIYEYQCDECDHIFEEIVFGDKAVPCPKCGCAKTGKLISRTQRCRSGGGDYRGQAESAPASRGGGCAGCAGGSCSTCG
ncbi:MAG: zinc ribbon domain-containing protein [Desulfovibrionaceae bacterium]|nr:zinc ribbon domain-containing protein [Desulfovibrionaceae bacterium]MBF0512922.1 zinc ribbon domain-containing protein [Desulfovibrionaceae bacterium]